MRPSPRTTYYVSYYATYCQGGISAEFMTPDAAFFDMQERAKKSGYTHVMWTWEGKDRRVRAMADEDGARWMPVK